MKTTEYLPTVQRHIEVFRSTEKLAFDRLLRFYQGKFYSDREAGGPSESQLITTSINLTYAIVETALSTLTPRNPQITAMMEPPVFYRQFKQLALVGYFTSTEVGEKVLAYDPIPGRFEGCVPLASLGGKAWSL